MRWQTGLTQSWLPQPLLSRTSSQGQAHLRSPEVLVEISLKLTQFLTRFFCFFCLDLGTFRFGLCALTQRDASHEQTCFIEQNERGEHEAHRYRRSIRRDHGCEYEQADINVSPALAQLIVGDDIEHDQIEHDQGQLEAEAEADLELDDDIDPPACLGHDGREP